MILSHGMRGLGGMSGDALGARDIHERIIAAACAFSAAAWIALNFSVGSTKLS